MKQWKIIENLQYNRIQSKYNVHVYHITCRTHQIYAIVGKTWDSVDINLIVQSDHNSVCIAQNSLLIFSICIYCIPLVIKWYDLCFMIWLIK